MGSLIPAPERRDSPVWQFAPDHEVVTVWQGQGMAPGVS
jgi:hypothetical protein